MGDLVYADIITSVDMDPSRVLDGARNNGIKDIVIIGCDDTGEFYFASNLAASTKVQYYLQRASYKLNRIEDQMEKGEIVSKRLTVPDGPTGDVVVGPWQGGCEDGGGI